MPVETPLGRGWAFLVESTAHDNFWTVILNDTRALVTFRQRELRVSANYTYGRSMPVEKMKKIIE